MAVVSNPLIGATSGSVGGVTFSKWKGINVIKTKPTVVANPQSDKQTAQRVAFAFLIAVFRLLSGVISIGFKELAIRKSAYNAFQSFNIKNAFDFSAPPAATFLPEIFLLSKGTMSATIISGVDAGVGAGTIVFTFPVTYDLPGQSASDKALMGAFNADKEEWTSKVGTAARSTGTDSMPLPATWEAADVIHCYLGFTNVAGDMASDSVYLEESVAA